MAVETQADFSGGLNTRSPSHLIGANQLTELQNADMSFNDLRGEYGTASGGESEFYYEAGSSWVSGTGFTGAALILAWPSAYSTNGTANLTASASANYFTGSPNATLGTNVTLTINDGVTITLYSKTQGINGANSYVEYNDDLYISRSAFTVTGSISSGASALTLGNETYKVQVGDEVANTTYVNTGTYITFVNMTTSVVTLSSPAIATASSQTFTINSIISKYVDGDTTISYRTGVNKPTPTIITEQKTSAYITGRDGSYSDAWYSTTDPIPFQYGIAEYDATGVESTMAEMTDSNVGSVGGSIFPAAGVDNPQYISISGVDKYTSSTTNKGRFALYRVGGTSAFIKRCDNLFLDGDLTVATAEATGGSPFNHTLTVTLGAAKDTYQYKIKWYSYNQSASAGYRYYNASTGYVDPFVSNPGSTVLRAFTGESEYKNSSSGTLTFVLDASSTTHYTDIIVLMKIPGELIEREYVCRAITHANTDAINTTGVDYIDFNRADALVDIQPIEEDSTPVRNITGLIESSNLFFAFKDNRLYVSDYGNPNSWPKSGFLDFDQDITGLGTLGSELVVFTEYGMYRVFGSDPSLLKKVQIPTTEGVKAGARKTISKFQSGLYFAGLNGICFYNGQSVTRSTQNNLDTFALPNATAANNHGGYFEDTYYLLGSSGTGYKMDVKGAAILSRTTMTASNLFFRGSDNTLYGDTGRIGYPTGSRQAFTVTTRKFVGSDINMEKVFYSLTLTGESFAGTINFLVDGTQTDTFSVGSAVTDLDRTFYLAAPRSGNGAQVQLSSCTGIINKISVNYDGSNSLTESLFTSVKMKYIGTPTVLVTLDGSANIPATTLSAPTGTVGEGTLYFLAMSTGIVPHLRETNNEASGRVLEFAYVASEV